MLEIGRQHDVLTSRRSVANTITKTSTTKVISLLLFFTILLLLLLLHVYYWKTYGIFYYIINLNGFTQINNTDTLPGPLKLHDNNNCISTND